MLAFQISIYISIGFLPSLIYAEVMAESTTKCCLTDGTPGCAGFQPALGGDMRNGVEDIRTLATKCCHNHVCAGWDRGSETGRDRRLADWVKTGVPFAGTRRNRVLREFTTNYTFQGDVPSVSSFSGSVTGGFGLSVGHRLR